MEAECTNGLKWIWEGVAYGTTAGHCVAAWGTSQEWFRYSDYRYTLGHAIHWSNGFDGDIALIRQTDWGYRNWFWVGGIYGGDEREITGSDKTPVTSQQVWISGANSGFTSATVADPETRSVCSNGSPTTSIQNSTPVAGDSGGPVVAPNAASSQSGDYLAMGILICGPGLGGFTRVQRIADRFGGFAANY